jgi:hypothetical protein
VFLSKIKKKGNDFMNNEKNNEYNDYKPNVMRGVFYGLMFEAIGICTIWWLVKIILLLF